MNINVFGEDNYYDDDTTSDNNDENEKIDNNDNNNIEVKDPQGMRPGIHGNFKNREFFQCHYL